MQLSLLSLLRWYSKCQFSWANAIYLFTSQFRECVDTSREHHKLTRVDVVGLDWLLGLDWTLSSPGMSFVIASLSFFILFFLLLPFRTSDMRHYYYNRTIMWLQNTPAYGTENSYPPWMDSISKLIFSINTWSYFVALL